MITNYNYKIISGKISIKICAKLDRDNRTQIVNPTALEVSKNCTNICASCTKQQDCNYYLLFGNEETTTIPLALKFGRDDAAKPSKNNIVTGDAANKYNDISTHYANIQAQCVSMTQQKNKYFGEIYLCISIGALPRTIGTKMSDQRTKVSSSVVPRVLLKAYDLSCTCDAKKNGIGAWDCTDCGYVRSSRDRNNRALCDLSEHFKNNETAIYDENDDIVVDSDPIFSYHAITLMRWYDGKTLNALRKNIGDDYPYGYFDSDKVARDRFNQCYHYAKMLLSLYRACEKRICFRDLKPENLVVDGETMRMIDCEFMRSKSINNQTVITSPAGTCMWTFPYEFVYRWYLFCKGSRDALRVNGDDIYAREFDSFAVGMVLWALFSDRSDCVSPVSEFMDTAGVILPSALNSSDTRKSLNERKKEYDDMLPNVEDDLRKLFAIYDVENTKDNYVEAEKLWMRYLCEYRSRLVPGMSNELRDKVFNLIFLLTTPDINKRLNAVEAENLIASNMEMAYITNDVDSIRVAIPLSMEGLTFYTEEVGKSVYNAVLKKDAGTNMYEVSNCEGKNWTLVEVFHKK